MSHKSKVVHNPWTHYEADCTDGGCCECYEWSTVIVVTPSLRTRLRRFLNARIYGWQCFTGATAERNKSRTH